MQTRFYEKSEVVKNSNESKSSAPPPRSVRVRVDRLFCNYIITGHTCDRIPADTGRATRWRRSPTFVQCRFVSIQPLNFHWIRSVIIANGRLAVCTRCAHSRRPFETYNARCLQKTILIFFFFNFPFESDMADYVQRRFCGFTISFSPLLAVHLIFNQRLLFTFSASRLRVTNK